MYVRIDMSLISIVRLAGLALNEATNTGYNAASEEKRMKREADGEREGRRQRKRENHSSHIPREVRNSTRNMFDTFYLYSPRSRQTALSMIRTIWNDTEKKRKPVFSLIEFRAGGKKSGLFSIGSKCIGEQMCRDFSQVGQRLQDEDRFLLAPNPNRLVPETAARRRCGFS